MTASDFLAAGDWSLQRFKQMGQPFVGNIEAVEAIVGPEAFIFPMSI
jgi:hypothetical protein